MADWKSESLNIAGRTILLKAALDSLPTYWFSTFLIPSGISNKLEAIRRGFLWGEFVKDGVKLRKLHLLRWDKVKLPKNSGGLGLNALVDNNRSVLGKWWYRWMADRKSMWNKYVKDKYDCSWDVDLGTAL